MPRSRSRLATIWADLSRGYPWLRFLQAMALVSAGMCLGARLQGGSVWVGLAGLPLLLLWLVLVACESGPDDPR